jgi:cell division protein FtsZ
MEARGAPAIAQSVVPQAARPQVQQASYAPAPTFTPAPLAAETVTPQALQADVRKKAPSLFEKMTSRFASQAKAATPNQPAPRQAPRAETQPTLQASFNLDPTERLGSSRQEEETLDIPAFLRRQAN